MGIEIAITDHDLLSVVEGQAKEIAHLRVRLESAQRVIRELDLSTPEGASKLVGIVSYEEGDEDELPVVQDQG